MAASKHVSGVQTLRYVLCAWLWRWKSNKQPTRRGGRWRRRWTSKFALLCKEKCAWGWAGGCTGEWVWTFMVKEKAERFNSVIITSYRARACSSVIFLFLWRESWREKMSIHNAMALACMEKGSRSYTQHGNQMREKKRKEDRLNRKTVGKRNKSEAKD